MRVKIINLRNNEQAFQNAVLGSFDFSNYLSIFIEKRTGSLDSSEYTYSCQRKYLKYEKEDWVPEGCIAMSAPLRGCLKVGDEIEIQEFVPSQEADILEVDVLPAANFKMAANREEYEKWFRQKFDSFMAFKNLELVSSDFGKRVLRSIIKRGSGLITSNTRIVTYCSNGDLVFED